MITIDDVPSIFQSLASLCATTLALLSISHQQSKIAP